MTPTIQGKMTFKRVVVEPDDDTYIVSGTYTDGSTTVLDCPRVTFDGFEVTQLTGTLELETEEDWIMLEADGDTLTIYRK